jgi:hypothetical protein
MRRTALAGLCLALTSSGCSYNTWMEPPFTSGTNPNAPIGTSENLRRVTGEEVPTSPLTPEPGDIWPGPLPPAPTLQDLEQQGAQTEPQRPTPGSPEYRGSSTPPVSAQPGLAPLPEPAAPRPTDTTPPARNPAGQVYSTPQGPGVSTGGASGYQTLTTPGGGSAIVVPNGNGTSTIIHSDGRIETVPTPR